MCGFFWVLKAHATACFELDLLYRATSQGYPLEMSTPAEHQLRLSFAKPLKASDPRSRGQNYKNYHNYSRPAGQQGNDRYLSVHS